MNDAMLSTRKPNLLHRLIERAFFPELPPLNLAFCRIVLGVWVLYYFGSGHGEAFVHACTRSSSDLFRPIGVVTLLDGPLNSGVFRQLYAAMFVSSVCFVLGFAHRFVAPLFALLQLFLWTYRNSWGFIYHTENTLVFGAILLALSPASDTWSIDSWIAARFPKFASYFVSRIHERPTLAPLDHAMRRGTPDYRYGWPIQLAIFTVGINYSIAGWAKIGAQGLAWADGSTLEGQILRNAYWYEMIAGQAPPNTVAVLQWPSFIFTGLATMTLICETLGPLVVIDRRLSFLYAAVMFGFHWGVMLTMGIPFIYHLYGAAFAAFIPWEEIKFPLQRWQTQISKPESQVTNTRPANGTVSETRLPYD